MLEGKRLLDHASVGEGPPILALHGGMGGLGQSRLLARALFGAAKGYRVITVSRPGYPGTPIEAGRTPEEQADLYTQVLESLDTGAAIVAAVSAGGPSALQFALRYPHRCRALILVSCCTGRLETPPAILSRLRAMTWLAHVPGLASLMRWRIARAFGETARRSISDPEVRARTLGHPEAGPMLRDLQLDMFERLRERLPGTINDTSLFAKLQPVPFERISAPALVIHGKADCVVDFRHAQTAARQMQRAELFAIEDGEHVALFTHLDEVRARTSRFLAALPA